MVRNHFDEEKRSNPLQRKAFPNYLITQTDNDQNKEVKETKQADSFIAESMLDATPTIPFLRQSKDSFNDHLFEQKEEEKVVQKDYFVEEKKRFEKEKRTQASATSFSLYKSRRPFKPTEVPSLWNSLTYRTETDDKQDYSRLKKELQVADDDLILVDLNPKKQLPPSQTSKPLVQEEVEAELPNKAKKALNRSLLGIMEEEGLANQALANNARPAKPNHSGFHSFFE